MPVMETIGLISLGSGLLSGVLGMGESDREKEAKKLIDEFDQYTDFFESTAFTKEELFNQILPAIQQTQRGAGDVAAGRAGAALGEGGLAEGGGFADAYIQAIAPYIAKGEQMAGQTQAEFAKLWADMDISKKSQLIQFLNSKGAAIQGLEDTTGAQDFFTNFLRGAEIGEKISTGISTASSIAEKSSNIDDMLTKFYKSANQPTPKVDVSKSGLGST